MTFLKIRVKIHVYWSEGKQQMMGITEIDTPFHQRLIPPLAILTSLNESLLQIILDHRAPNDLRHKTAYDQGYVKRWPSVVNPAILAVQDSM